MKHDIIVHCLVLVLVGGVATGAYDLSSHVDPVAIEQLWEEFKLQNGKVYADSKEEFNRYNIWIDNYYYVQSQNRVLQSTGVGFKVGLNSFCDMTHEEVSRLKFGLKLSRSGGHKSSKLGKSERKSVLRAYENLQSQLETKKLNSSIPESINWAAGGYVSSVKDQGVCGTGALESQLRIKQSQTHTLSEQQLIDCSKSYGNEGCDGGLMSQAFDYVRDNEGIYSDSVYSYVGSINSCKNLNSNKFGPVAKYVDLPVDENVLKEAVASIGPIAIGIDADHKSFTLYKGGIYFEPQCSSENLNHAVLIVGYGQENGQDYWLFKNSWGTSWGESGYGRIARNKNNHCGIASLAGYPLLV